MLLGFKLPSISVEGGTDSGKHHLGVSGRLILTQMSGLSDQATTDGDKHYRLVDDQQDFLLLLPHVRTVRAGVA